MRKFQRLWKLLNDVCMALNQASNPSTLMYTSSLPIEEFILVQVIVK